MLKLIVLNGKLQGSEFDLFEGMTIGNLKGSDVIIKTIDTVEVVCDDQGNFSLQSQSKKLTIDLGGDLLSKLEAAPGMIFSVGSVGFSIQESHSEALSSHSNTLKATDVFTSNETNTDVIYPIKNSIKFTFVRGALLNTDINVHWHPFTIGTKSNFNHFIDEHINFDDDILSLEKSKEEKNSDVLIRPFISNFISINNQIVSKPTIVKNGDLVEFSNTAFYIKIT